jgi:hypothetical protein
MVTFWTSFRRQHPLRQPLVSPHDYDSR